MFACPKTDLVENAFHRLRQVETRAKSNMSLHPRRAWFTAYQQSILSGLHNFPEARHDEVPLSELGNIPSKKAIDGLHNPSNARPSDLPLQAIVDESGSAFWPTFSANSRVAMYAHLAVWREALRRPSLWQQYDDLDLSVLILPGLLVRRCQADGEDIERKPEDFVLVLGVIERVAALGWQCDYSFLDGRALRQPRASVPTSIRDMPYSWLICTDPSEWEAIPVRWAPPATRIMREAVGASASGAASSSSSSAGVA